MLGNFVYYNPTVLYFGRGALSALALELPNYGPKVQLIYGGGSIKKNGIYDQVTALLRETGKEIVEDPGVMPNPATDKLYEGCRIARAHNVDLLLAVGGGSCCDYAKGVAVSAWCEEDPWEKYYVRREPPDNRVIPVGCVLTMVGTGSEMNSGSVITNPVTKRKVGPEFGEAAYPKFSILDPVFTYSLPKYQMTAGIFDIMSHILEQYLTDLDDCTSDYIMEGLMRSLIHSSRVAIRDPYDYQARSNLMWASILAMSRVLGVGHEENWLCHMLEHAVSAKYNIAHGAGMTAILPAYLRFIAPQDDTGKLDALKKLFQAEDAAAGLEAFFRRMGLPVNLTEALGFTPDEAVVRELAQNALPWGDMAAGGYAPFTLEDAITVLSEACK